MPALLPEGLGIAGVLPRENPLDAVVLPERPARGAVDGRRARRLARAVAVDRHRQRAPHRAARAAVSRARASRRSAATSTRGCASSTKASTTRSSSRRRGCGGSASPRASRSRFRPTPACRRPGRGSSRWRFASPIGGRATRSRSSTTASARAALDAERARRRGARRRLPDADRRARLARRGRHAGAGRGGHRARRQPGRARPRERAAREDAAAIGARVGAQLHRRRRRRDPRRRPARAGRRGRHPAMRRATVYLDRRRPRRSRSHHGARPRLPRRGRRRPLRPPRASAPAPPRARRRGEDRRRRRRAAAARAGSDLLSARREGARGQDRRAPQVGRPVRLRGRRLRSALPARAGRALRGGAGHSRRHRRAQLRGRADHVSGRRRHADLHPRPRGRGEDARGDRLDEPRASRRHDRLLRRAAAAARTS